MSGTYHTITFDDMHFFLAEYGYRSIVIPDVNEVVYSKVVGPALCCRVYTSIVREQSREVGEDAIRVCLVARLNDGSIKGVGSTTKVYRLATWKENLAKRLNGWSKLLGPECPTCGALTAARKGRYGAFWGCIRYPECKGIAPYTVAIDSAEGKG